VYSFTVWQQDDPKVTLVHFLDSRPPPDSAIGLNVLMLRMVDDVQYPLILD
jgi:hypothetical protein